ncbi:MAG: Sua5/YciO/YrdC/YwlC family protein, partial [Candidatus Thioglobus sp.]|uniref:Sua5/YciO/YrdC/YwlC family protein n=1 Tax=Candidatus Thioglobus sp. TaxID=2026721 RepID=UPI0026175815
SPEHCQLIGTIRQLTGSALVSTSANLSGYPVAQNSLKLRLYFKGQLDYIIAPVTTNSNPSSIINLHTGEKLR